MPPSPSPRRFLKEISDEKRHSFGSILPAKSKDDELTLFTDMQKHDRDNVLLEPAEDFYKSISKFSYFLDLKLGVHIAARGENRDLLNADSERNDYDWLLTPSETPLFCSLDDEEDQHIGMADRGRAQIKQIAISRSSTVSNDSFLSSDPGFSFEAPPNLRTSLSDRLVSSSRGGSPSSFSGLDMNRRGRRQSMSPTPSRRASSCHSNDRDRFGSYSKASATCSAKDDLESMQSIPNSYSSSPTVRKNLPVMKSRTITSPKKPSKIFYPSSAPKRSFDSAVWLMDQRKAPQGKFRPLLSSVPSTTLGAVKGDDVHSSMLSHNSSLTTSTNLSSEHGVDQEQSDVVSECEATPSSVIDEDIFMFDKLDVLNEGPNCHQCSLSTTQSGPESPSTVKYAESTIEGLGMEISRIAQTHAMLQVVLRSNILKWQHALVDEVHFVDPKIQTLEEAHRQDHKIRNSKPCAAWEALHITLDCIEDIKKSSLDSQLLNDEPQAGCLQKCPESKSTMDTTDRMLSRQYGENVAQNLKPHDIGDSLLGNNIDISSHQCCISDYQQKEPTSVIECDILRDQTVNHHNEKSSSNKWPIVEGRPLAATNILCSEPYYTRESASTLTRTIGWDSSSAASSIDQGSSRQSVHFERLKSSERYDFEKSQISSTMSCQSIASMSDMSTSNCSVSICPQSNAIVDTGFLTDNSESSALRTMICPEEFDES
ncbi:hypothetical protein BAE44_0003114, partial [Dichanthelium oligosanthes]